MVATNERRRFNITSYLMCWDYTQNNDDVADETWSGELPSYPGIRLDLSGKLEVADWAQHYIAANDFWLTSSAIYLSNTTYCFVIDRLPSNLLSMYSLP